MDEINEEMKARRHKANLHCGDLAYRNDFHPTDTVLAIR